MSTDNKKWIEVDGGRIFTAIPERGERLKTYFVKTYHARYIRFHPISRGNAFGVRLAWIQGCDDSKLYNHLIEKSLKKEEMLIELPSHIHNLYFLKKVSGSFNHFA